VQQASRRYYSFLSVSWGFVSDVDIESDRLRFLGTLKNTIYVLLRILSLRNYKGRLSFSAISNWTPDTKNECQYLEKCRYCSKKELEEDTYSTQVIEDEFVLFWAMNSIWASHDLKPTPHAHLADGAMDLLIARKGISRSQLLKAFLLCASGKHLSIPYIEYYKVRSFQLEPLTKGGIFAVDGERIDYSPLQVSVLRGVAKVFGC
jgi:sphingosine kinase